MFKEQSKYPTKNNREKNGPSTVFFVYNREYNFQFFDKVYLPRIFATSASNVAIG